MPSARRRRVIERGQQARMKARAVPGQAHVFQQVAGIGGGIAVGAVVVLVAGAAEQRAEDDDGIGIVLSLRP
nr:hypothetical protein [Massilia cavernae]